MSYFVGLNATCWPAVVSKCLLKHSASA